jgi:hypothetical protein
MLPGDVLAQVQETWIAGFQETSVDELESLLEEMVGLGILVGSSSHRYRLRSPNVLRLLGGEDDVQDKLARFENEPYESDDPKVIHLLLEPVQAGLSSPLTLAQEEDLLVRRSGVSVSWAPGLCVCSVSARL